MYLNEGIIYTHTAASGLFLFEAFQKLGFPRVSHMIPTTKKTHILGTCDSWRVPRHSGGLAFTNEGCWDLSKERKVYRDLMGI